MSTNCHRIPRIISGMVAIGPALLLVVGQQTTFGGVREDLKEVTHLLNSGAEVKVPDKIGLNALKRAE